MKAFNVLRPGARAGVLAVLSMFACAAAQALGLGRLSVQSAPGEPLRAEVEVTSLTVAEEASLSVRIAPPQAYRSAGIEYHELLSAVRVTLERRADGRVVVALRADRPARDPFIDVILEASWSAGRLVREYTLLMNRPEAGPADAPPPGVIVAPILSASPSPVPEPAPVAAPTASSMASPLTAGTAPAAALPLAPSLAPSPAPQRPAIASPAPRTPSIAVAAPVAGRPAADPGGTAPTPGPGLAARPPASSAPPEHVVQPGETLFRIATQHRLEEWSLDQMLVALYRANPDAFLGQNMNRLMAGASLKLPTTAQPPEVTEPQAREVIQAHSADFAAYRASVAAAVPRQAAQRAGARQATGRVDAQVQDRQDAGAATPDRLKLSQGGVAADGPPEAALSRRAEARDAARREAALARNVEALRRLQQMAGASSTGAAAAGALPASGGAPRAAATAATSAGAAAAPTAAAALGLAAAPVVPAGAVAAPASAAALTSVTSAASAASAAAVATAASAAAAVASAAASAASAAARAPAVAATVVPTARPPVHQQLLHSPVALLGVSAFIAVLASLGAYRLGRGRRTPLPDAAANARRSEGPPL